MSNPQNGEAGRSAGILLSGAYERRRGYLTATITTMNQLAVMATLGIWTFSVKWESIEKPGLLALQIAWAGALSSTLIGLWRFYAHSLDHAIVRLYPALYISERALLPVEVCTLAPPQGVRELTKVDIQTGVDYCEVLESQFGSRGHRFVDVLGALVIVFFAAASLWTSFSMRVITIAPLGPPHLVGLLLLGNTGGLALILLGASRWRNAKHKWPVPRPLTAVKVVTS